METIEQLRERALAKVRFVKETLEELIEFYGISDLNNAKDSVQSVMNGLIKEIKE